MIAKLKKFLQRQDSLERTLFWVFLVIVLAASVASTVLTTEAVVADKKEENPAPAPQPGMNGGMY